MNFQEAFIDELVKVAYTSSGFHPSYDGKSVTFYVGATKGKFPNFKDYAESILLPDVPKKYHKNIKYDVEDDLGHEGASVTVPLKEIKNPKLLKAIRADHYGKSMEMPFKKTAETLREAFIDKLVKVAIYHPPRAPKPFGSYMGDNGLVEDMPYHKLIAFTKGFDKLVRRSGGQLHFSGDIGGKYSAKHAISRMRERHPQHVHNDPDPEMPLWWHVSYPKRAKK